LFNANDARKEVAWPYHEDDQSGWFLLFDIFAIFQPFQLFIIRRLRWQNNPNFSTVSYNYSPLSSLAIQGTALPEFLYCREIFSIFSRQPG